jgi:hypothetical protein
MKNRYKAVWDDYFEGGLSIWSYFGYRYHSYLIVKHILSSLALPKTGKIIQMGCGIGITVELLCCLYGEDRVIGYDLFNPLSHPNIKFLDTTQNVPTDTDIAFLEIDIMSMSDAIDKRRELLRWAMNNVKQGGYILTNRKLALELKKFDIGHFEIIDLFSFDIPELWKNVHESRINTKVILKILNNEEAND